MNKYVKLFGITIIEGIFVILMVYVFGILYAPISFDFYSGVTFALTGAFAYDTLRRMSEVIGEYLGLRN